MTDYKAEEQAKIGRFKLFVEALKELSEPYGYKLAVVSYMNDHFGDSTWDKGSCPGYKLYLNNPGAYFLHTSGAVLKASPSGYYADRNKVALSWLTPEMNDSRCGATDHIFENLRATYDSQKTLFDQLSGPQCDIITKDPQSQAKRIAKRAFSRSISFEAYDGSTFSLTHEEFHNECLAWNRKQAETQTDLETLIEGYKVNHPKWSSRELEQNAHCVKFHLYDSDSKLNGDIELPANYSASLKLSGLSREQVESVLNVLGI